MTYFTTGCLDRDNSLEIHSTARNNHTLLSSNEFDPGLPAWVGNTLHLLSAIPWLGVGEAWPILSQHRAVKNCDPGLVKGEPAKLSDCYVELMAQHSHLLDFFLQIYTVFMRITQEVLAFLSYIYLIEHISLQYLSLWILKPCPRHNEKNLSQ